MHTPQAKHLFWTGLFLLVACGSPRVNLTPGGRIIFLGDSITETGAGPGGYVVQVRDSLARRYPELGLEVIGAGISGNKVPDLEARLARDVLALRPTLVFVYIGINDVWHSTMPWGGTPRERYRAGLASLLSRITAAGIQAVLCTPTVIGERHDGTNPLDAMLDDYAAISRAVAREQQVPLLDLRYVFLKHLTRHNLDNAEYGVLTIDGVHLNAAGNQLLAETVLDMLVVEVGR